MTDEPKLSPDVLTKDVLTQELDERDARRRQEEEIKKILHEKTKDLSEDGAQLYMEHIQRVPIEEGKTIKQIIDEQDGLLDAIKAKYPKETEDKENITDPQESDEPEKGTSEGKVEPRNKSVDIGLEKEEEDDMLPKGAEGFLTTEGSVNAHKNRLKLTKQISRFAHNVSAET